MLLPPGGLGQMCKDIGLVINDSRQVRVPLLVASAANQYYLSALSLGMENADIHELIKVIERMTILIKGFGQPEPSGRRKKVDKGNGDGKNSYKRGGSD